MGKQKKHQTLKVNIPGGISEEESIRVKGKGNVGLNGGDNGDLLISVKVCVFFFFSFTLHLKIFLW